MTQCKRKQRMGVKKGNQQMFPLNSCKMSTLSVLFSSLLDILGRNATDQGLQYVEQPTWAFNEYREKLCRAI